MSTLSLSSLGGSFWGIPPGHRSSKAGQKERNPLAAQKSLEKRYLFEQTKIPVGLGQENFDISKALTSSEQEQRHSAQAAQFMAIFSATEQITVL